MASSEEEIFPESSTKSNIFVPQLIPPTPPLSSRDSSCIPISPEKNTSEPSSLPHSPKSKPRLSFDETLIQQNQSGQKKQSELHCSSGSHSSNLSTQSKSNKSKVPGQLSAESPGEAKSICSNSSRSHPSLAEDKCSEIMRLDSLPSSSRGKNFFGSLNTKM